MRITIIAAGRLKERFWSQAVDEYLKRLSPYADVRVIEVPDRDPARGGEERALAEEGAAILKVLPDGAHVIVLAIGGKQLDSEQFAERMERLAVDGRSSVAFVVGGSVGLSDEVLRAADERLSLGPMTLPHNLARVVLVEQLYRSFKIRRGEPYHK